MQVLQPTECKPHEKFVLQEAVRCLCQPADPIMWYFFAGSNPSIMSADELYGY